uniref:Galactose mutarotase n=1 Tax=Tetraodon nigroviridis TaxID=99883 RepID=H3CBY5_TETNG
MTEVSCEPWGQLPAQGCVHLWRLQSSQLKVEVLTLGATIRSVWSRGRDGQSADVVLGFDDLEGYVSDRRYLGATVGRVANRIAKGRFVVDGVEYQLDVNNGPNALHGGRGFSKALWRAQPVDAGVQLSLTSPDGDQGYPGEVQVWLTYTYRVQGGTLTAEYRAQASKTTPINLTNHSYFN